MPVFHVPSTEASQRLDRFLAAQVPELSRSRLASLIKEGAVTVNGRVAKPSLTLSGGETIELEIPEDRPAEAQPQEMALDFLYEDDDLAVVNKPSGLVVHPGAGHEEGTLVNGLLHRFGPLSSLGGVQRPGIVHRLDKETSGCLVVARNDFTHAALSAQFAGRETEKIYYAVVQGVPAVKTGRIENYLARHPVNRLQRTVVPENRGGKLAITDYEVIHTSHRCSLVRCVLHTGRTHQIRVHLKHLGHPLLGDELYAKPARQPVLAGRLLLHAWRLAFTHPRTQQWLTFTAPLPSEFSPFLPPDFNPAA